MKRILIFLALASCGLAGTWIANPGKGSHAAAGGGSTPGTQLWTDNFNRSETPISGTGWSATTDEGGFNLNGSNAVPADLNNDASNYNTSATYTNDQWAQVKCTVTDSDTGEGVGVVVRHAGGGAKTYYRAVINSSGVIELGYKLTGSYTTLTTRSVTYSAGKVLGLSVSGTTLKIWYDGAQQGANVTDSTLASGSPGISYSSTSTSPSLDDWAAGSMP